MTDEKAAKAPEGASAFDLVDVKAEAPSGPAVGAKLWAGLAAPIAAAACSDGGGSPSPSQPTTPTPPAPARVTSAQASRFLSQAAIGYSKADLTALTNSTLDDWLTSQFSLTRPQKFWDYLVANGYSVIANQNNQAGFDPMVWSQLMGSTDVLRQRVGLALLNLWVVGIDGLTGSWRQFVMADYLDRLWDNAFGNYRDIMEAVSTSVGMAQFLTFLNNAKANPTTGSIPDENYARELMQLFTIGLFTLNPDGTPSPSAANPTPTYTQADIAQHARVWTGYVYANTNNTTPDRIRLGLVVDPNRRETGASSFVGISVPAGVDGATARRIALDGLFNHPNTAPFVCKQLIQRLVTSNPSANYVARVAAAFANNGSGVRGDMKAVIRAILTDSEARDDAQISSTTFGKLREPVVRLTQWARAFNVTSPTNAWPFGSTASSANRLAESPGRAPSVFNWFRPGYTVPGGAIAAAGLVAPEFQIANEPSVIAYVNYMQTVIASGVGEARPDYSTLTPIAGDSQALLDELNLVLAANQISSATIGSMKAALDTIPTTTSPLNRIYAAILLVMACPEYLVQR
ncbi:MAG: DUF1800 domain-containing protein [Parvularculaceae bacterium]|nr:DUF1800 domain-containing protein [Parvularculaceae bacterium]